MIDIYAREQLYYQQIKQALADYAAHTCQTAMLDRVGTDFICRLAKDAAHAKSSLRELFSKSPNYDEELDALVLHGSRDYAPDFDFIYHTACKLVLDPTIESGRFSAEEIENLLVGMMFFKSQKNVDSAFGTEEINKLVPGAYKPGRKPSRVLRALAQGLGIEETPGFRSNYARLGDELSNRKLGFTLYVSINPAHFLTMSNPKGDDRGGMLTSCHSLNSLEYEYNNGCTGYARDQVSFIAFTVGVSGVPELLNNRKNTRQVFAYEPGNGLLLQSRMYNVDGGVHGTDDKSKIYRELIQREIADAEGVPNLWKTNKLTHHVCDNYIECGSEFGGYPDWEYETFDPRVSYLESHADTFHKLTVGEAGLCLSCGCEISTSLFCEDCGDKCASCGGIFECGEDTYTVYNSDGEQIEVCYDCWLDYSECECCGHEYHDDGLTTVVDCHERRVSYCPTCAEEYVITCEDCEEEIHRDCAHPVHEENTFEEIEVCEDCFENYYIECDECGEYYHKSDVITVDDGCDSYVFCPTCAEKHTGICNECGEHMLPENSVSAMDETGCVIHICDDCCYAGYTECDTCGTYVANSLIISTGDDDLCPICAAKIAENVVYTTVHAA